MTSGGSNFNDFPENRLTKVQNGTFPRRGMPYRPTSSPGLPQSAVDRDQIAKKTTRSMWFKLLIIFQLQLFLFFS